MLKTLLNNFTYRVKNRLLVSRPPVDGALRKKLQVVFANVLYFARHYRLATIGALTVLIFIIAAAFAPLLAPHDPNAISLRNGLHAPSAQNLLGTDHNGRDMLSRIIYGARISLFISCVAVLLGASTGVLLGTLSGWFHSLEMVTMRVMDIMLSFPSIILALVTIAILGTGIENVIVAIAINMIPTFARLAHVQTLSVKNQAYVTAAISIGVKDSRILFRHILPNIISVIIVQTSLVIPSAIMTTAGLSFLGLGVTPPMAEWGSMLQDSVKYVAVAPHLMVFPGLSLLLVVFGFNTFGDGLRAWLDPKMRNNF